MSNQRNEWGFTLTELIVAMSVFIIATTIISGVFVRAVRTQRQVGQLMAINSDASLIIERMAREIRSGYDFDYSNTSCDIGSDLIIFTKPKGTATTTIVYRWDAGSNTVERAEKIGGNPTGADYDVLNASQTKIGRLCFIETRLNVNSPWRITAVLAVGSKDDQLAYETYFQTTVSSRILPMDLE
ncbi:MAG TPA: type II secretion system protein [Candidatus Jorgensenbacteria bacterium]|nr:type II secretion system protein [Candidatus Jorgensenbacteria bacterium]